MTLKRMDNVLIVVEDVDAVKAVFVELGMELDEFPTPVAVGADQKNAAVNTLGIRRIMVAVDDLDEVLTRLRTHGGKVMGEIVQRGGTKANSPA